MLAVTHALAGSAIYKTVNNKLAAYSLAFGSHYLLDMMPHYELSTITNCILLTGAGLGVGLAAWKQNDWGIPLAGLLSILPDINYNLGLVPSLNKLHFQVHTQEISAKNKLIF